LPERSPKLALPEKRNPKEFKACFARKEESKGVQSLLCQKRGIQRSSKLALPEKRSPKLALPEKRSPKLALPEKSSQTSKVLETFEVIGGLPRLFRLDKWVTYLITIL
jgi:hypothetical protein